MKEQDVEIATAVLGPGHTHEGPYGDWAGPLDIPDAGALLVRPDGCVAFRHPVAAREAASLPLAGALQRSLGRARARAMMEATDVDDEEPA